MSLFFWRKKKEELVPEPAAAAEPVKAAEEPVEAAEEPVEAAEEPAETAETAEEPAEESAKAAEEPAEPAESAEESVKAAEEPAFVEEAPVEEASAEDAPAEEAQPTEESEPAEEAQPSEESEPAEEAPVEEASAEDAPAEEAQPTEESEPAAEAPVEEASAEDAPAEEAQPSEESEPAAEQDLGSTQIFAPVSSGTAEPGKMPVPAEEPEEEAAAVPEPVKEAPAEETVPVPAPNAGPEDDPEEEDEYEERRPRRRSRAWLWIFLLLLVIGGSYYYGRVYSRTHFLENTYINDMNVSGMTAPEVEKILSQKADGYALKITFRDGEEEVIDGTEIGFKVKPDGSVDRILQSQDHDRWFMCFFRRTDGEVEQKTTYDPVRLKEAVAALPELQKDNMVKPVNAYIELSGTKFSIVPEIEGNLVKVDLVQRAAEEAVRSEEGLVEVASIKGSYSAPKVRAKDKKLVEKCEKYNKMLAGSITWQLPNGDTMKIDKETTVNWLSQDEDGNYYRDEDKWEENIEFWVDELARNVNTVGKTWNFHATGVGDIEVSGGDYGYSVDKASERDEVWDLLWDGESDEREPYFYTTQYTRGSGIGGTYIEANLSQQHVYIYIDGVMVCDTPCVSGNISNGHGTPTGVYQILYKDTDCELRGQQLANGQYSYISHVDYWMPFYGGCGFHDASWRSSFGGSIYKYDGSHGCINLPPSILPTFYSNVSTGMPVVVFY